MDTPKLSQFYSIHYEKEIGKGISGSVYQGIRKCDKLDVAIKLIFKKKLSSTSVSSITNEVGALQRLDHPHIVRFYNMYEDNQAYYICLELVRGGELFDRISKKTFYTEREARDICLAILSAIKHCHDRNIVHRDLKPENLMMMGLDDDTNVKLVDFGFSAEASGLTLTGHMGTPIYMAPEIYGRKAYGKPVDMWAFGVIVYILLCGYAPFSDEKRERLERRIQNGVFAFHEEYWKDSSAEAKDFISKLLSVNVSDRLTVDQAIFHPWLRSSARHLSSFNLSRSLTQLQRFNAKRKLRAVIQTIITLRRWGKLFKSGALDTPDVAPLTVLVRQFSHVADGDSGGVASTELDSKHLAPNSFPVHDESNAGFPPTTTLPLPPSVKSSTVPLNSNKLSSGSNSSVPSEQLNQHLLPRSMSRATSSLPFDSNAVVHRLKQLNCTLEREILFTQESIQQIQSDKNHHSSPELEALISTLTSTIQSHRQTILSNNQLMECLSNSAFI